MTVEVKKATELKVGENYLWKSAIYGKSGTGKTRSLRTAPKPLGVIDVDKGMLTNRGIEGIEYIEIDYDSDKPRPEAWDKIKEGVQLFAKREDIKTIALDSVTTISDACLKKVLMINKHQSQQATLPDYMLQIKWLEDLFTTAIGSGKHLIVTAHEEFEKNEFTGQLWCLPMIVGKLASKLPIWFDEVYHTQVTKDSQTKEFKYEWLTRSDIMYTCKSRLAADQKVEAVVEQDFIKYAKSCGVEIK
jgi:hypothetical protein